MPALDIDAVCAWTTQRMANRLPLWSRARLEQDSVAQTMLNPSGSFFDGMIANSIQAGFDYYVPTVSLSDFAFLNYLALPADFAFQYDGHQAGKLTFLPPTVTATEGVLSITPTLLERNKADSVDVDFLLPTRTSWTNASSQPRYILSPTSIGSLSGATFSDTNLTTIGTVFVQIAGGDVFGVRDNRDILTVPKVVIKGIPYMYGQEEVEEHIPFLTNLIKKSKYEWQEINSVEVRGITGTSATVAVFSGFNRDYVANPYATVTTPIGSFPQVLSVENEAIVGGVLNWLQYKTFEVNSVDLQTQGESVRIVEHETLIRTAAGASLNENVIDIEMIPNSRYLAGVTQTTLFLVDTEMPHPLNILPDLANTDSFLARAQTEKSFHPEMRLMVDKHDIINTETDGFVNLTTWHKKRLHPIVEVRLTGEFLTSTSTAPLVKMFDAAGVAYDVGVAPNEGWIQSLTGIDVYDPQRRITDWKDIAWVLSPSDIINDEVVVALFKLEARLTDGTIETDTVVVWSLSSPIVFQEALPVSVAGVVTGMTFSAGDKLVVQTTDTTCYELQLHYDYYLIDYYENRMWFLEEYDSVVVDSS